VVQAVLLIASVVPCADLSDTPKPDGCTFSIQQYV